MIDKMKCVGLSDTGLSVLWKVVFPVIMAVLLSCMASCGGDDSGEPVPATGVGITGVYIPDELTIEQHASFVIKGTGFVDTDRIIFTDSFDKEFQAKTEAVSASGIEILLPEDAMSGSYTVTVMRADGRSRALGRVKLTVVVHVSVPDKDGCSIKGMVSCSGKPVSGVVISDGVNVTVTDGDGYYWLPSDKKAGMVFMSVPSGYMPESRSGIPQFFKRLTLAADKTEQADFSLSEEDNDRHVVLAMADAHLANRSSKDVTQFQQGFIPDVNELIDSYTAQGTKVYGITLGDQSWDRYWYDNNFSIKEATDEFSKVRCPIFHCMGNHDNDVYASGDWNCAQRWRDVVGPTYYSFNLGKVHYVVLDDVEYVNNGSPGVRGEAGHNALVTDEQMRWLVKDLATVSDKAAPLVICMHIPLHTHASLSGTQQLDRLSLKNASELISAVAAFSNVKFLTGHTHINYDSVNGANIHEYNIGGVCATWWWTGAPNYHNNHICREGSPGGYGVFEWTGTAYNHYYKGIGHDRSYQMRAYDLNGVHLTPEKYCPRASAESLVNFSTYVHGYDKENTNNEVLINVFGFGHGWSIEVTESDKILDVTRVCAYDPLHIISFELSRLDQNKDNFGESSMKSCLSAHFFKVKASGPATTLNIKVTDEHGNVYTQTMTRPKQFTYAMK